MSDEVREGGRCSSLPKTMTTEHWNGEHDGHGAKTWKPLEAAPEGYAYAWICCPCGAQHLRKKEDND